MENFGRLITGKRGGRGEAATQFNIHTWPAAGIRILIKRISYVLGWVSRFSPSPSPPLPLELMNFN